jgi:hypothetical protein
MGIVPTRRPTSLWKKGERWPGMEDLTMLKTVHRPMGFGPLAGGGGGGRKPPPPSGPIDPSDRSQGRPEKGDGRAKGKRERRKRGTRMAFWAKWAGGNGAWRLLQRLGAFGVFGTAVQRAYDGMSNYDKDNYNSFPMGFTWEDENNATQYATLGSEDVPADATVVYLRFPIDESSRILSGIQGNIIDKAAEEIFDKTSTDPGTSTLAKSIGFAGGQLPGLNPAIRIAQKWVSFFSGGNPIDDFRGKPILTRAQAGAPLTQEAVGQMLGYTFDEAGLSNFFQYNPDTDTTLESVVKNTPLVSGTLGRLLRFGRGDPLTAMNDFVRKKQAAIFWIEVKMDGYDPHIGDVRREYNDLATAAEAGRLVGGTYAAGRWPVLQEWYANAYEGELERLKKYAEMKDYDTEEMDEKDIVHHFEILSALAEIY